MTFRDMVVEIGRSPKTRNLSAVIIQQAADGPKRGPNMLMRRNVRRIETAKQRISDKLIGGGVAMHLTFEVKASPDWVRTKTKASEATATA